MANATPSAYVSVPPRPATPTWAWSAPPCSTGRSPATHGGTFVFRIEDTDAARDSEESYEQLLDSLRWLGFDWDEGPEIGGPHAPYRQSQRMDIYKDVAEKLLDAGHAYHCYCTTEELDARRDAARAAGKPSGYDGHCRDADRRADRARTRPRAARRSSASGCPTRRSPSRTWSAAS